MSSLRIAPIVEGHGDVAAVRLLLDRIWRELLGGEYVEVLQPVRSPRSRLLKLNCSGEQPAPDEHELGRAVRLAAAKLEASRGTPLSSLVLILLDANSDCPKVLAPEVVRVARQDAAHVDIACTLAKPEYETWFVAAAESLTEYITIAQDETISEDPERRGSGKGWIERRFKGPKYSETVDQPRMTAKMDLTLCRRRSPSFDKLCRELESRLRSTV